MPASADGVVAERESDAYEIPAPELVYGWEDLQRVITKEEDK